MKNMLDELWYGSIDPLGRATDRRTVQYSEFHKLNVLNGKLESVMHTNQLDDFEEYKTNLDSLMAEFERESFKDGFKIATRLFLSCFEKDSAIFDEIL